MTFLQSETLKTANHRLAYLQSRAWLPPALLLLALSSVFMFGSERRGYYYKDYANISHTSKFLAIADNLSFERPFGMFIYQTLDENAKPSYGLYNRFPIGSFALVKLTFLPFGNNLSAEIYAARTLTLLFFAAAAVLAYLSLRRITSSRWIALTAVLLAFSSAYCLYFSDVPLNEVFFDIFAVILVFHGIAIFEQDGRFRQLLLKTCAALLLGWHVYGLLLPFIAFGLMRQFIKSWSNDAPASGALYRLRRAALSALCSRYLTLGIVALLFGVSMLTFNFTSEYFALNRETPLTQLPSFQSLLNRTGVDALAVQEKYGEYLHWPGFIERQFYRIGLMSLPYAFSPPDTELLELSTETRRLPRAFIILGVAAFSASLIGLPFIRRHRMLLAVLALSGICWALPMRHNTALPWHNFEGLFYIGVALTLFALAFMLIRRLASERLVVALSVAALLIFALSAWRMTQPNTPDQTSEFHKAAIADFENIRNTTDDGAAIWINSMLATLRERRTLDYYFARRFTMYGAPNASASIDFVVTDARPYGLASLTPHNQILFLYEWDGFHARIDEIIAQAGAPLIRSSFDVYISGNTLIYTKDDCSADDISDKFFLAVHPANESVLSDDRRQYGYDDLSFQFHARAVQRGERCIAIAPLPDYHIDHVHTGQYIYRADGSFEYTWEWLGTIHRNLLPAALAALDEIIAQADEPLIRSDFDVYQDGGALIYVKDDCRNDDVSESFFLTVFPADQSVLSDDRRRYGYDDLSFQFQDQGVQRGARCIAVAPLPDYHIDHIHTGQYIDRADGSFKYTWGWNGKIHTDLSPVAWEALDKTIEQAGAPLIRSDFDVYQDGSELIYVKDDCRAEDLNEKFFLVVYPVDESDLSDYRRQYGYDNIDFRFKDRAARRGERCIAIAPLPEYAIDHIHTGQYIDRADGSFEHTWEWNGKVYPPE